MKKWKYLLIFKFLVGPYNQNPGPSTPYPGTYHFFELSFIHHVIAIVCYKNYHVFSDLQQMLSKWSLYLNHSLDHSLWVLHVWYTLLERHCLFQFSAFHFWYFSGPRCRSQILTRTEEEAGDKALILGSILCILG